MSDQNTPKTPAPVWTYPHEAKDYYSNSVTINHSLYDFVLDFALSQPNGDTYPVARIRMTSQHAWVFYHVLKLNVESYIKQMGTFSLPQSFLVEKGLLDAYKAEIEGEPK